MGRTEPTVNVDKRTAVGTVHACESPVANRAQKHEYCRPELFAMIDLMCALLVGLSLAVRVLSPFWCLSCRGTHTHDKRSPFSARTSRVVCSYIAQWLEMARYHEVTSDQHQRDKPNDGNKHCSIVGLTKSLYRWPLATGMQWVHCRWQLTVTLGSRICLLTPN